VIEDCQIIAHIFKTPTNKAIGTVAVAMMVL
jgi:hypothetical protein